MSPTPEHRRKRVVARARRVIDRLFPAPRPFSVQLWDATLLPADGDARFTLRLHHPAVLRRLLRPPVERSFGEAYVQRHIDVDGDVHEAIALLGGALDRPWRMRELASIAWDVIRLPRLPGRVRAARAAATAAPQEAAAPAEPAAAADTHDAHGRSASSPPNAGTPQRRAAVARSRARLHGTLHSRARDREAIRYHYDVGNDFYALWLDRNRQYSCAYFRTGREDIDVAQEQKLEHICRKLRLQPGERLLDIGCGWGGLALYAAERWGCRVTGVTLSREQMTHATRWAAERSLTDRVQIRQQDYRDIQGERFDKVVSVGMVEHVGGSHLAEYFAHVFQLLHPGGLFLNHGISRAASDLPLHLALGGATRDASKRGELSSSITRAHDATALETGRDHAVAAFAPRPAVERLGAAGGHRMATTGARTPLWRRAIVAALVQPGSFRRAYVFPDGELVPVSRMNLVAERAGFEVRDVENLREHYALTLRRWVDRLQAQRDAAVRQVGDAVVRVWQLYMAGAALYFESGAININQTLFAKPLNGRVSLPFTRQHLYAQH
ncbi:MAG TPA: cyclopropane-fatty-acyl-phospholipid synthase family protein [Gemmatimonadaceae bacterium]|nr:cyclopropane-fatty-acyl-phospholipid synthase family protein [Gemmatimonadaceae bacterium]